LLEMIANFFTGVGISLIIGITMTMVTEFIPRDNRGTASTVFFRFVLGCAGTIIADPMVKSLGCGWTFTLWALVALANSGVIILLKVYGPKWRMEMEAHLKSTARG
jgi:MFS family permease